MASPADHDTEESRNMQPDDWPGERNPNQWDVHDAHQVPADSFLRRFKAALLLSEDVAGFRQFLPPQTGTANPASSAAREYTYPMAVLSQLPSLPENGLLAHAQARFNTFFKPHVFLSTMVFPAPSAKHIIPPYLKVALACLGTATSIQSTEGQSIASSGLSASELFLAGDGLWGVMMEVDNREARLLESVLAGCLFATYGMLSANEEFWDLASSTIVGAATMARRIRIHHDDTSTVTEMLFLEHSPSTRSLLMSYLFLVDITRAAHCGRVACFSTKELFMRMPSSPYNFHHMYSRLLAGTRPLPSDLKADEDSLLLLIGICADILYMRHSFSDVTVAPEDSGGLSGANLYPPLSPASEALEHYFILYAALDRWTQHFGKVSNKDILSMFYFCKLLLALPDVLRLPSLAGYPPSADRTSIGLVDGCTEATFDVSDEALNFAWLILDNSNARADPSAVNVCIWHPVVLFFAALTVWRHLHNQTTSSSLRTGTLRTLNVFKDELTQLPWPCCVEMCRTLDTLMSRSMNQ